MLEALRKRHKDESGFTLVELLVVMLILGILAAIAIPSFFNQRDKANDAEAKSAARTAQTAMETYATDNGGEYTDVTLTLLEGIEPTLANADLQLGTITADSYALTATSDTDSTFTISQSGGISTLSCLPVNTGGCPADGNWGD